MRTNLDTIFSTGLLTILLTIGCSDTEFNSKQMKRNVSEAASNDGDANGTYRDGYDNLGGDGKSDALGSDSGMGNSSTGGDGSDTSSLGVDSGSLAEKGKSLDLYFMVDVSGSLKGTDPDCDRWDAILDFKKELTDFLGIDGDVRTTFIKFSDKAKHFGTINDWLGMSDGDFKNDYKSDICDRSGNTNTSDALEETVNEYKNLKSDPKDVHSALLFTDGIPTKGKDQLDKRIDELKDNFGKKIFSVLLWNELGGASRTDKSEAEKLLRKVTGSSGRVKSVDDPSGIGKAIADFLK